VSSITTDQGIVHYEVFGRGRPVILLHGWLGSWALWQETMAYLNRDYRTYALDFWGFGESGKKRETYAVQDFVSLVDQFMERLGIGRAPVVGHSMGGTVTLSVALQYPHRVSKVAVVGSPIVGSSLAWTLKLAGYRPIALTLFNMMSVFRLGLRAFSPLISKSPNYSDLLLKDLSQTTLEPFLLSIASLSRIDLRPRLHEIKVPVLGIYGDTDTIVNPHQWQPLQDNISDVRIKRFLKAGHLPMLDEPQPFMETLKSFLDEEETIK
jgi:pimeloyl-ACP methyl ester carboxylesterase